MLLLNAAPHGNVEDVVERHPRAMLQRVAIHPRVGSKFQIAFARVPAVDFCTDVNQILVIALRHLVKTAL
jgi:hypothetical protein